LRLMWEPPRSYAQMHSLVTRRLNLHLPSRPENGLEKFVRFGVIRSSAVVSLLARDSFARPAPSTSSCRRRLAPSLLRDRTFRYRSAESEIERKLYTAKE
jgi:hypothetical protein